MSLVYRSLAFQEMPDSVGTHVLAIGIGEYPHLVGGVGNPTSALPGLGQIPTAAAGALAIATWFTGGDVGKGFNNPTSPLASVALLVSPPSVFTSPTGITVSCDTATSDRITSAFSEWLSRLQLNENNVGVLYYCGHGVLLKNDTIIPSDFGKNGNLPWSDAFDIGDTITAVRRLIAGPLYFFLDMCRENVPVDGNHSPKPLLPLGMPLHKKEGHMLVLQGSNPGGLAFARSNDLPVFTAALLSALAGAACVRQDGASLPAVTSRSLSEAMPLLMQRLMPQIETSQIPHAVVYGADRAFHVQLAPNADLPIPPLESESTLTPGSLLSNSVAEETESDQQHADAQAENPRMSYKVGKELDFTRTAREDEACLNVDRYADVVADLFAKTSDELCFAIFGAWGRGKTFLADRIGIALTEKVSGSRTIRFSAWKYPNVPEVWVYLYETFAEAAFTGPLLVRLPNIARTAIAKSGYWGLLLIYATIAFGAVPIFSLLKGASQFLFHAYLVLGVYGMIFIWTLFSGVKKTKGRLTREYLTPNRHTEKLGLQATIGKDLRYLLEGWIPTGQFDLAFILGYWLITMGLVIAAILRLGGDASWPSWLNANLGLHIYAGGGSVATAIAVALILVSAALVFRWLRHGGQQPTRILLIVDDLDRCRLEHLISVVESIKLLIEDPAISKRVQVMMLVEEEVLKHAILEKYGRLTEGIPANQFKSSYDLDRLTRENCEKLFTAHLRLPQLLVPEVRELVEIFSGFRKAAKEEIQALKEAETVIDEAVSSPPSDTVLVNRGKRGTRISMTAAMKMGDQDPWVEAPVPPEFRPATPDEMEKRQRETSHQREASRLAQQGIADRIRALGDILKNSVLQRFPNDFVSGKVLSNDEVTVILAALVDEDIKLRDNLGPRTVRAFLFRYQLARLILIKLEIPWNPEDLARDLAVKFMISTETKNPLPPSANSPDIVNLARVIEQVS
ncbi:P-loop NTPase fold protein [Paraburkholderia sediminicola]|uniref:P-loop NTPase fold protein n=1 Tax=Paraburkholderia sediminicola TaxID=458836 RepID=UPI0038B78EB2